MRAPDYGAGIQESQAALGGQLRQRVVAPAGPGGAVGAGLLAAEAIGSCTWNRPFSVEQVLANVAWDAFPRVFPALPVTGASAG